MRKLRPGDLVEVKSREEILSTLDSKGQLRGMPFMPEMFQHCGKRLRVYKRAHKTCDTAKNHGTARWLGDAVLLDGIRCGGESHGGCQAACLVFWWHDWLKEVPESGASPASDPADAQRNSFPATKAVGCTEEQVMAGTLRSEPGAAEPVYVCQATQLPHASTPLPWWDIRQYVEDCTSGNTGLLAMLRGFIYVFFFHLNKVRFLRVEYFYDKFQGMVGGIKFPRKGGRIPKGQKTPACALGLKPGELVKVKSYEDILSTINDENKNLGLRFDAELVPYCGGTHRVLQRVSRIIDEGTGKMFHFKTDSIMLENVNCHAKYSNNRMFCPRAVPCFWREIWLERAEDQPAGPQGSQTVASITVGLQPPAAR